MAPEANACVWVWEMGRWLVAVLIEPISLTGWALQIVCQLLVDK